MLRTSKFERVYSCVKIFERRPNSIKYLVESYQMTLLILLSYCENVPSSAITNIPLHYFDLVYL
jgi:hypothetical protein